jgi:anti-anti-sigma factor
VAGPWPELLVTAAALVLFSWRLDRNGYGNAFYAAAVRSMTTSWHNFLYASFDPGGWITVDKPPLAFWPAALSARVFGYSSWTVLLPSAIAGAATVWILMATVRRPWGRTAGLVAGVVFALTPVVVAIARSNNPDMMMVFWLVAAAWSVGRGIEEGRLRWTILAGGFCGFGFLAKLLAAGMVMPGLWLAYLVAAPGAWRARVLHCIAGGLVFLAIAGVWIVAVDAAPLSHRPWIGGSDNGNALSLVLDSDGFGRVFGTGANDRGPGPGGGFGRARVEAGPFDDVDGSPGLFRLFDRAIGDQVMWLAPGILVVAVAAGIELARRRKRDARLGRPGRTDRCPRQAALLLSRWRRVRQQRRPRCAPHRRGLAQLPRRRPLRVGRNERLRCHAVRLRGPGGCAPRRGRPPRRRESVVSALSREHLSREGRASMFEVVPSDGGIRAWGELDVATAPILEAALAEELRRSNTVTLDLDGLDFMDSSGLSVLVANLKRARSAGGDLVVIVTKPGLRRLFDLTGLSEMFNLDENNLGEGD